MKKQQIRKVLSRFVIIIIMALILHLLIKIKASAMPIFYWSIASFMLVNFWLHLRLEKRGKLRHFFIALGLTIILSIVVLMTLILWALETSIFRGFWANIFGWHGFISMILITAYALMLFDKSCREDLKCWFNKKIGI